MDKPTYQRNEGSAPFNLGISTLMRLDNILIEIYKLHLNPMLPANIKQSIKVSLVKQLFLQSSPLLKDEVVELYRPQFEALKPCEVNMGLGRSGVVKKTERRVLFSPELELKLDQLTLEIQREIQKEKYFMPPKSDPRVGWKFD